MDEKGFIFSWDAVLALIPVFVVITAIFNVNYSSIEDPNQDIRLSHMTCSVSLETGTPVGLASEGSLVEFSRFLPVEKGSEVLKFS